AKSASDRVPQDQKTPSVLVAPKKVDRRSPEVASVPEHRQLERLGERHPKLRGEGDELIASVAGPARGEELRLGGTGEIAEGRLAGPDQRVRLVDQVLRLQPVLVEAAQRGRPAEIESTVARRERGVVELEDAPCAGGKHDARQRRKRQIRGHEPLQLEEVHVDAAGL